MVVPVQTINVRGLTALNRNLQEISDDFGPQKARRILALPLRNALQIVGNQIAATTPQDTGRLAALTDTRARVPSRQDKRANPDVVYVARTGWFWPTGDGTWFQALAVEFGTRYQQGDRTLRNALESNAQAVVDQFSSELGPRIERRANQLRLRAQAGRR